MFILRTPKYPAYDGACWIPDRHSFFARKMNENFESIHSTGRDIQPEKKKSAYLKSYNIPFSVFLALFLPYPTPI